MKRILIILVLLMIFNFTACDPVFELNETKAAKVYNENKSQITENEFWIKDSFVYSVEQGEKTTIVRKDGELVIAESDADAERYYYDGHTYTHDKLNNTKTKAEAPDFDPTHYYTMMEVFRAEVSSLINNAAPDKISGLDYWSRAIRLELTYDKAQCLNLGYESTVESSIIILAIDTDGILSSIEMTINYENGSSVTKCIDQSSMALSVSYPIERILPDDIDSYF